MILSRKYVLVHSHGFSSGILAAIPARLSRVKHLITPHDIFHKKHFTGMKGTIKKYFIARILSQADIIQPVSFGAENNLLEFMPYLKKNADKKISTIVNGIDVSRFAVTGRRNLHAELGLNSDVFLIGFMGRFMSQKGFKYLVLAVKKILQEPSMKDKVKIVAVGSGGFIREEVESIRSEGMQNDVCFLPGTNQVAMTMKGMGVLVMPSLWEACSLLAMESLVAGVPIIGTNCIGLGEVLEGSPAKIVDVCDVEGLADAIREYMSDNRKGEFERYAKEASQRYDICHVVDNLTKLYSKLIA